MASSQVSNHHRDEAVCWLTINLNSQRLIQGTIQERLQERLMKVFSSIWDLRQICRLLTIVLVQLAFFSLAQAQDLDTVTITGKVADQNGAVIPGATIVVTLVKTGVSRTINSDDQGRYRLIQMEPGVYTLRVSSAGFATQEKTDLTTVAGQNVQLDLVLLPESVAAAAVVTISTDAPQVDTTRTVVGGTVTTHEVESLP